MSLCPVHVCHQFYLIDLYIHSWELDFVISLCTAIHGQIESVIGDCTRIHGIIVHASIGELYSSSYVNLNKCETKSEKLFYYLFRSGRVPNTSPANNLVLGGIQVLGIVHESRLRLDRVLTPWPCTRLDLKISWASISSTYS